METPSATRRVTRSQTHSKKIEEFEMNATKSRERTVKNKKDQAALVDITNESPIIGLANASYFRTPSSLMSKKRANFKIKICTPGSGEALLRDQVRTLLEKVEEEAEFSKISQDVKPFHHFHGMVDFSKVSPVNIIAPTPANTPQFNNFNDAKIMDLAYVTPSLVVDKLVIPQMGNEFFEGKKDLVTKSLLFEFSEKLDECDSSAEGKENIFTDDDDESVWSLQVNVGNSPKDEIDGVEKIEEEEGVEDEDVVNELCEGLGKINLVEERKIGKHLRFVYDSDGEVVEVEEDTALCLRGLPKPEGKHIRFQEEEEEEGHSSSIEED